MPITIALLVMLVIPAGLACKKQKPFVIVCTRMFFILWWRVLEYFLFGHRFFNVQYCGNTVQIFSHS